MPTREKELQCFFTSVGVSFQNTHTFWESGGMFWGPKIYFPKIQRSSFRLCGHMPHTFGVSVYFCLAGILPAIRELRERTPAAKGREGKNIVTDKAYVLTRYQGRYKG
jgi:hypothetical protein